MPGRKPDKKELARMKAMSDLGVSPTAIAKKMEKSHNTILKYLRSEVFTDPDISQMVAQIKEKETADLYLIGGKARQRIHELLDGGKMRPIEAVATMDRAFQQRRLLEGQSTINLNSLSALVIGAAKDFAKGKTEPIDVTPDASENKAEEEKGEAKDGKVG